MIHRQLLDELPLLALELLEAQRLVHDAGELPALIGPREEAEHAPRQLRVELAPLVGL